MAKQIPLRGKYSNGHVAIVDDGDYALVSQFRWCLSVSGYANGLPGISFVTGQSLMHRLIMQPPDHLVIDHINHDRLDNRRSNLRIATYTENSQNSLKPQYKIGTSSKYKGVTWNKVTGAWSAQIVVDSKHLALGTRFLTQKDAAIAYNQAAVEYHGAFASLNIIRNDYEEPIVRTFAPLGDNPYRGVRWHFNKWQAWICIDGNFINFGDYDDPKEAAKSYDRAVLRYRGRDSLFNLPDYIKTITNPDAPILVKATSRSHAKFSYRGVVLTASAKWKGRITIDKKRYDLGVFATPEEAARAVDRAELTKVSLFYYLNFPEDYDENTLPPGKWPTFD